MSALVLQLSLIKFLGNFSVLDESDNFAAFFYQVNFQHYQYRVFDLDNYRYMTCHNKVFVYRSKK